MRVQREKTVDANKGMSIPVSMEIENASLLDDIIQASQFTAEDNDYGMLRSGVETLITRLLAPGPEIGLVSKVIVDDMIAEIDSKISLQMDAILHNRKFQQLESAWLSFKFLIDRTDFQENIRIELLQVAKDELLEDFEDVPEVTKSGLYRMVYTGEYGQFGGQPYGVMISNYEFGPIPQDVKLLQYTASVAAMSHAPFIAAADPRFFGISDYKGLSNLKDIKSLLEGPQYIKWQLFRESDDSRNVALVLPRFLLRLPYTQDTMPVKSFNYEERVSASHLHYSWGNAAFAFATRVTDSFAKSRWCADIVGPQDGGTVEDLPLHHYEAMGMALAKIPTEVLISESREYELAEEGFITLTMRRSSDSAAFFSANSVQKPKYFGNSKESKEKNFNYKLGTQLPYILIISRLAHYIKVIQREHIGTWKERRDLDNELNNWIRQYVADMDNPMPGIRSRRPLRQAQVFVEDVEGNPGWYRVRLNVRPHFKYMGAFFTLSLVGKLDKE
jgi:type VI secretion system protein ImpC